MTKARARAKARLAAKATQADPKNERREVSERPGFFDAKSKTKWKFGGSDNMRTKSPMRRGAARSR